MYQVRSRKDQANEYEQSEAEDPQEDLGRASDDSGCRLGVSDRREWGYWLALTSCTQTCMSRISKLFSKSEREIKQTDREKREIFTILSLVPISLPHYMV